MTSTQNWYKDWWKLERFDGDLKKEEISNVDKNDRIPREAKNVNVEDIDRISEESEKSNATNLSDLKHMLLQELRKNGGDVTTPAFEHTLTKLSTLCKTTQNTPNHSGFWATLSKPNFRETLGRHPKTGEYQYTLGRMSFDMFPRGDLICSVRGSFNIVTEIEDDFGREGLIVPKCLSEEDLEGIMTYK